MFIFDNKIGSGSNVQEQNTLHQMHVLKYCGTVLAADKLVWREVTFLSGSVKGINGEASRQ